MKWTLLLLAIAAACEGETYRADLVVRPGSLGFQCVLDEDPDTLMAQRFVDRGVASLVVDYLRFEGLAGCRTGEILDWCSEHDCTPIAEHRVCIDLPVESSDPGTGVLVDQVVNQLSGRLLTSEAPKEPVMIRAVLVANTCSEIPSAGDSALELECESLLGCVHTCPIQLGEISGDVALELDTLSNRCQRSVEICASSSGIASSSFCE